MPGPPTPHHPAADDPADPLPLATRLIAAASVSRDPNAAAAAVCEDALVAAGFRVTRSVYRDRAGVEKVNLLARLGPDPAPAGSSGTRPGFVWLGHTDVVPAETWAGPGGPFAPVVEGGRLYGRGACDMKGPVACALAAAARLARSGEALTAPLWVGLTADEEVGFEGAKELARDGAYAALRAANPPGVIGEPTGLRCVHAHKGSHLLTATARGKAAHSGTGEGVNANLKLIPFLADLRDLVRRTQTDPALRNAAFDPPGLSWNLTLSDGNSVLNVVPGRARATVYSRPVPGVQDAGVVAEFHALAAKHGLETTDDRHAGPFRTDPAGPFPTAVRALLGQAEPLTVCYGTDAAVFASAAGGLTNLVVLGPGSIAQAHTADEFIELDALRAGCDLYETLFRRYCTR